MDMSRGHNGDSKSVVLSVLSQCGVIFVSSECVFLILFTEQKDVNDLWCKQSVHCELSDSNSTHIHVRLIFAAWLCAKRIAPVCEGFLATDLILNTHLRQI